MKPGDKLKDNDPRCEGRVLEIIDTGSYYRHVVARAPSGREVTILKRRIYSDGKPRKSGFDLVKAN